MRCWSGSMLPRITTRLSTSGSSSGVSGSSTIQPPPRANIPVAAGLGGRREFGAQRVARGARRHLERHPQGSPREIPVEAELRGGDRNLMLRIGRIADRAALREDRSGQRLRAAVRADVGIDRGRHQRVGAQPRLGHAQREQIVEQDLARLELQAAVALQPRRQRRAQRPRPFRIVGEHGEHRAARPRPAEIERDLRQLPLDDCCGGRRW